MRSRPKLWPALAGVVLAATATLATADIRPHAGMLRFPDVSAEYIVFSYANDLWLVPRAGGTAIPLASPPGGESFPRFSEDGQTIAFVGNYDGNDDLYTIPVTGGVPQRVTHHPDSETLSDWTPDGKLLFFARGYQDLQRQTQLFTVPPTGGLPAKLPVPYGAVGAISPDGVWLAYTPHTRDGRTWKRYLGGMASDIWLFNLHDYSARQVTDWAGTDSQPMWHDGTLYYMSDQGPAHRLNIWKLDPYAGDKKQVTFFKAFDVAWPAIGPGPDGCGEIVFQCGASLYLLDLATEKTRVVEVIVPGDRPHIRPQRIDASDFINGYGISATGKRVTFEARGDVWSVPAKLGPTRNLTHTSGTAERDPAWSPDGQWIAYFSDATGEYELYVTQSDGKGETRQLTRDGEMFRMDPTWSPDSAHIAFVDKSNALHVVTVEDGKLTTVDQDPWGTRPQFSWSHDAVWIAYTKTGDNHQSAIWLYNVASGEKTQVTSGMFNDTWPAFDRDGDYLYFATNRHFANPIYEDVGSTFVYANTDQLAVVPLRADMPSPWQPRSNEEEWDGDEEEEENGEEDEDKDAAGDEDTGDEEADDESEEDPEEGAADPADDDADEDDPNAGDEAAAAADVAGDEDGAEAADEDEDGEAAEDDEEEEEPLKIDLDGFERRAMLLPVKPGGFYGLTVAHDGALLYVRTPHRGSDSRPAIKRFKLPDPEGDDDPGEADEKTVISGVGGYDVSADGKKLLVAKRGRYAIIRAAANQKMDDAVPTDDMRVVIEPRAEWRQLVMDAWRIERDYFYDPHMHGVDWKGVRDHYLQMLDDCVTRADVTVLIREMIAEINVGHAYYFASSTEDEPQVSVGLLGVDFELHEGAYRIAAIHAGGPWDLDARGPLSQPGVDIEVGDYLLAVDGRAIDTSKDPWAAFQGLAGDTVALTVSDKPTHDDDAREVLVALIGSGRDSELRYRSWVERNRQYVAERSDGQVGYIHVPDTGVNGQNELFRQFYGQRRKKALIIDERWNGGGQLPHRFIELLNRPLTNFWAIRDGNPHPSPEAAHWGPKCMLINGLAGSGGDMFPFLFRQAKVGKLIGTRTWGGLVGISGNPQLIDGGFISAPTFAFYELDGTWGIEGYGVDPDIEVVADPSKMVDGSDPQLDAAIKLMLDEIKTEAYEPVPVPEYPDRSGMGLPPEDR